MADYLGLQLRHIDSTETGGSSYLVHVGHAAAAIAAGKVQRGAHHAGGPAPQRRHRRPAARRASSGAEGEFENLWGAQIAGYYAMAAQRHMYEFGTTRAQLAEIKVAASLHAQHNPHAFLRNVVTVDEVLASPMVADPLHRLDCCVITDGGGALVLASEPRWPARSARPRVAVLGHGEAVKHTTSGRLDLTHTGARVVGCQGVRRGGRDAGRHRLRLDLRQLHHHRAADASRTSASAPRARAGASCPTAASWRRSAGCRSTPTAAGCATTTRPTAAA